MFTKNWKCLAVLCALTLSLAAAPAGAAIIQVDNNANDTTVATWNEIAAPGAGISVLDSSGNDDGVTVTYSGWTDSGFSGVTGAYSSTIFDDVAGDYFFQGGTATVTISGLLDSETYTFQLASSTNNTGLHDADFTVGGSFGDGGSPTDGDAFDARGDGFDSGTIMSFSGVSPTLGDIVISATRNSGSQAYFNAFTIEGNFVEGGGVVPEPSTLVLAGIGLLGLLACGRRRRRRRA